MKQEIETRSPLEVKTKKKLSPTSSLPRTPPPPPSRWRQLERKLNDWWSGKITPQLVSNLMNSFSVLLRAGIPAGRCVEVCAEQEVNPQLRRVLIDVYETVSRAGVPISTACTRHPEVFPQEVLLLMKAGELSGQMASRLDQAARLLDRQVRLANKIREAVTSPLMTAGTCMLMTWAVVRFVLPRFLDLYDGMHVELPLFSQIVIAIVRIINNPFVTFGGLATLGLAWQSREALLQRFFEWGLKSPGTRGFIGQLLATTFCDVVGHLYADGVAISTALEMLASTTRIKAYRRTLQVATAQFKIDGRLSEALKGVPYFPPAVVRMIRIGEETGQIDKMLFCIGSMLDESNQELFTRAVSVLEPLMMAGVGVVLCFFFVGLFLPIYGLLSHLGM